MENEVKEVTLAQMNTLCAEIKTLRDQETAIRFEAKKVADELDAKEARMIELLTQAELTNYRSPSGLVSISMRSSVKTPKTDEDKTAFYAYLKGKGLFDSLISVNSMTLNSFYKEERLAAEQRGEANFSIPGLNEVSDQPILSFRK